MATPDYSQWLNSVWGWPTEFLSAIPSLLGLNGFRPAGSNPPYTAADFLQMYPKLFGPAMPVLCETLAGSSLLVSVPNPAVVAGLLIVAPPALADGTAIKSSSVSAMLAVGDFNAADPVVRNIASTIDMLAGQSLTGVAVAPGATLTSVGTSMVKMSTPALVTAAQSSFNFQAQVLVLTAPATATSTFTAAVYTQPPVPLPVLNAYIALASSSLDAVRWGEGWALAVGLYVAHFVTLWMQTDAGDFSNPSTIARRGISAGVMVSKSADGLSASYQLLGVAEDWGAWNLTAYGQLLATQARTIGSGSMLIL